MIGRPRISTLLLVGRQVHFFITDSGKTRAFVFYVHDLCDAGGFGGGARRGAPNKPILVIKSGRSPAAQRLLHSHSGMD
ncbi:hypothetical protein ACVGWD_00010, partial [Enterobacter asburiae]